MNKIQLLKNTILYLAIVLIDDIIMVKTSIYEDWMKIGYMVGFFLGSIGLAYLCNALTQWIFPVARGIETRYFGRSGYGFLKPQIGVVKTIFILVFSVLLFFGLWVFNMILVTQFMMHQQQAQLKESHNQLSQSPKGNLKKGKIFNFPLF